MAVRNRSVTSFDVSTHLRHGCKARGAEPSLGHRFYAISRSTWSTKSAKVALHLIGAAARG